jgi:peptidyl-tRNA hydrolase
MDAADYVLTRFVDEEERALPEVVAAGKEALVMIAEEGITPAMNYFNRGSRVIGFAGSRDPMTPGSREPAP